MAFKKNSTSERKIEYNVEKEYGTLSTRGDWELKLRLVSWNGKESKYDIRSWKVDEKGNETCRRGLSLTGQEAEQLYKLLGKIAKGN